MFNSKNKTLMGGQLNPYSQSVVTYVRFDSKDFVCLCLLRFATSAKYYSIKVYLTRQGSETLKLMGV